MKRPRKTETAAQKKARKLLAKLDAELGISAAELMRYLGVLEVRRP